MIKYLNAEAFEPLPTFQSWVCGPNTQLIYDYDDKDGKTPPCYEDDTQWCSFAIGKDNYVMNPAMESKQTFSLGWI